MRVPVMDRLPTHLLRDDSSSSRLSLHIEDGTITGLEWNTGSMVLYLCGKWLFKANTEERIDEECPLRDQVQLGVTDDLSMNCFQVVKLDWSGRGRNGGRGSGSREPLWQVHYWKRGGEQELEADVVWEGSRCCCAWLERGESINAGNWDPIETGSF